MSRVTYLSGASNDDVRAVHRPDLGLLVTPQCRMLDHVDDFEVLGIDNGCYNPKVSAAFNADRYIEFIGLYRRVFDKVRFATAPDVLNWLPLGKDGALVPVGDAAATLERSAPILPRIRAAGVPAALVGQDGLELLDIPWDTFDCLFIGGSDDWKLWGCRGLVDEAKDRGKWVHMGRVSSDKRMARAKAMGCDSADGTFIAFAPDKNLARVLGWLDAQIAREAQASLFAA